MRSGASMGARFVSREARSGGGAEEPAPVNTGRSKFPRRDRPCLHKQASKQYASDGFLILAWIQYYTVHSHPTIQQQP